MRRTLLLMTALAAAPAMAQQAGEPSGGGAPARTGPGFELSSGIAYQRSEFGKGTRIETLSIPTGASIALGRFQFSATLPYLRVDAPGNVIGGGGSLLGLPIIVDPTRPADRERKRGVGDLRLGAAYTIPSSHIDLSIGGQVKAPTASERKGLGTGRFDYAVSAELSKSFGRITPFVGVGYTMPGDPDGYELREGISARAGAALRIGDRTRGHVAYGYARSLSPLAPDERQISTGIDAGLSDQLRLGLYGSADLSEGAPDIGAGVRLGFSIF